MFGNDSERVSLSFWERDYGRGLQKRTCKRVGSQKDRIRTIGYSMHQHLPHSTATSKAQAKSLRERMSETEKRLWAGLRRDHFGLKFRRQVAVGKYIVDFYCPKAKLVVELDGESHFITDAAQERDAKRQEELEALGLKVMRIQNCDVLDNLQGVLETIYGVVQERGVEKQQP